MPSLRRAAVPCSLALLASCARDEPRHVFQSAPPARATAAPVVAPPAAELAIGTGGPSARVVAVRLAATGTPASLDQVGEDLVVLALVSRGRGSSSQGPATIELRVTGSAETTLVERLGTPIPVVVAHTFRLPIGQGAGSLQDGRFELQVRLVGPTGRQLATSTPVYLGVRSKQPADGAGP